MPDPALISTAARDLEQPITITSRDGHPLAATVFAPARDAQGPVTIIGSAAAVLQNYYAAFARHLAARGRTVITFDYRGVGGSLHGPIHAARGRMRDWGQLDIPAVLDYVRATYPERPIHWVGHSYGGGFGVGLADNNHLIQRHLGIAAPHGYWREMASPERYRVALLMRLGIPLTAAMLGYLPGKRFGLGENLPADVAREWASWILARNSMWDALSTADLRWYGQFRAPMCFIHLADDPWATRVGTQRIADAFTGAAERALMQLGPGDTEGAAVGHLGFFRKRFADSLWPRAVAWLDATDAVTRPSSAQPL